MESHVENTPAPNPPESKICTPAASAPWRDETRPARERAELLVARMTLEEKVAQLVGLWAATSREDGTVAPYQHEMTDPDLTVDEAIAGGLGQLTRPYGSAPVAPVDGARALAGLQRRVMAANRFGVPALVHEECLSGLAAWTATAYPVPLSWGASFDPALVQQVAAAIGADMRALGVHQGLAPVLDVVRDYRWGRVEETIGEDPYLVGAIGSAYVRGLQSSGVVATLKHFAGYSASRAGRNHAPVSMGRRERSDVMLLPFEMVVHDARPGSVMHAYTDTDGVPAASDRELLTGLLRRQWGFTGTVVADYFGIAFLKTLHRIAETWGEAAATALDAGVDVELPSATAFGAPLIAEVRAGRVAEAAVDAAARRVLTQKIELGLLDAGWSPRPPILHGDGTAPVDLDRQENRELARRLAEESAILLRNDGILPLPDGRRIAVIGPNADEPLAPLGCYSFPRHVGTQHPDVAAGIALPTVREAVRAEFPAAAVRHVRGCGIDDDDTGGFAAARAAAEWADVVVLVLGDRAGLFGRGTSGEGCDALDLRLPGVQSELLDTLLACDTPVVLTLISGRPYALGAAADRAAAIVQTFFPGEEGATALAEVLSGRVNPSGRLPVGIPALASAQPSTYLTPTLGMSTDVSDIDPTPRFPFGHGLGFSSFAWRLEEAPEPAIAADGAVHLSFRVGNTGDRDGTEIAQVYLHDPVAGVVQPDERLIGFLRLPLRAGEDTVVRLTVPADLASFTGRDYRRVVEPGELELRIGSSSTDIRIRTTFRITGPARRPGHDRRFRSDLVPVTVARPAAR